MQILKLDHVNVRTANLEAMVSWYAEILGFQSGYRPHFPFPGAWLYIGETVVVHLVSVDAEPGAGSEVDLKLEHFVFTATGANRFERKLNKLSEPYRKGTVDDIGITQYNVWDPDGNHIHIDFPVNE